MLWAFKLSFEVDYLAFFALANALVTLKKIGQILNPFFWGQCYKTFFVRDLRIFVLN
jgi:hypothetical protein